MKLQSLNCPNCGYPLRTEGQMQYCDSCGSSFKIDYDESDVEFERLSKANELNKQQFAHEKEMLETQFRLQEEARIKNEKRQKSEARRTQAANKFKALLSLVIFLVVFFGIGILFYKLVMGQSFFDQLRDELQTTTTETTLSPYITITVADVEADTEFMENAQASVMSYVNKERNEKKVTTYDLPVTDWSICSDPEIYECYLFTSENESRLVFLVKMTYQSERDSDDTREVYDALYLKNIKVGSDGKIASDYSVKKDRGEGAVDWTWDGAIDSDQLYRSAVLGKTEFTNAKVKFIAPAIETEAEETEAEAEDED